MTDFGYEVLAADRRDDCLAMVQWAECWCPDAAQFVLVDAPIGLTADTADALIEAIAASHIGRRIKLVCRARTLADEALLARLRSSDIGFLLQAAPADDVESLASKGIIGVRIDAQRALGGFGNGGTPRDLRSWVGTAHDLGLRAIASQTPTPTQAAELVDAGFDYVSLRGEGLVPARPSFAWQRKLV